MIRPVAASPRPRQPVESATPAVALARAGGLWAATMAVIVGTGLLTATAMPTASGTVRALLALEVLFALSLVSARLFGTWRQLGVNRRPEWRNLSLLLVPLAAAVSPLVLGVRPIAGGELLMLVVGYTLTGITEELMWRGFALRLLIPVGQVRAVVIAAALFGAAHLGNVFYRDNVALVLAQAWGAFCFGLAYGALRHRIGTIVPLMVLHAVTDLAAAIGRMPKIPTLVAEDVVLLCLGVVLLARPRRAAPSTTGGAPTATENHPEPTATDGGRRPSRSSS